MKRLFLLLTCLAVAACGPDGPVDDRSGNTSGLPAPTDGESDATGAPPASAELTNAAAAPATAGPTIPTALHGRWGMAPDDCTSTRGDAKGLIVVGPSDIRFYESRAVPRPGANVSADSIRGDFTFTGEGQTWTKFQALRLTEQGLVRTESNPTASFTYAKCT